MRPAFTSDERLIAERLVWPMHKDFLPFLVDPETREPLTLEAGEANGALIETGFLYSRKNRYPIIKGVPRFGGDKNYSASFSYQWRKWPRVQFESENFGKPMEGHTRGMWERITAFNANGRDLAGEIILDIGCGPGRFIEIVRAKGAKVIGIDYSLAVEAANDNFSTDPDVCICQADALHLPIKSESLDAAYSIGVLHHTPMPGTGCKEAFRVIRNGGWFAISVYAKGGYYDFPSVQAWRRLFNYLWPIIGHYPPLLYTYCSVLAFRPIAQRFPLFGKAIRLLLPFVNLPDREWSLLDTFDSLTPSYQSAHTPYEVFRWLKDVGFEDIRPSDWGSGTYSCIKPRQNHLSL